MTPDPLEARTRSNIELVRRYIECCWNQRDASKVDELIGPNFIGRSGPLVRRGRAGVVREIAAVEAIAGPFGRVSPYVIEEMFAVQDWVVTRVSWEDLSGYRRDHLRDAYRGDPHISVISEERLTGVVLHRVDDAGLIVEEWRWLETPPLAEQALAGLMSSARREKDGGSR